MLKNYFRDFIITIIEKFGEKSFKIVVSMRVNSLNPKMILHSHRRICDKRAELTKTQFSLLTDEARLLKELTNKLVISFLKQLELD